LGVSIRAIGGFVWCGLLTAVSHGGKDKVNASDVKIIKNLKEDFPEELENIKKFVMPYFKSPRKKQRVTTFVDKVISGRDSSGRIPVVKNGNVLHLGLKESGL
jgi:hypothetical protein